MSSTTDRIRYVKHNKVSLKAGKREESTKVLLRFFKDLEEKATGMRGFVVMNNVQNSQDSVVLTFWESKEDMDAFYQQHNKALSNLVETLEPSFEHPPERKDYQVAMFKV